MITSSSQAPLEYQIPHRCKYASVTALANPYREIIEKTLDLAGSALLYGATGLGKTYAMVAAMNVVGLADAPLTQTSPPRYSALFVDWPEFIGDLRRFEGIQTEDRDKFDPLRRLCTMKCALFVDDVGQEQMVISGYRQGEAEAAFSEFVNRRTGMSLPLWITTNLTPSEIGNRYGERTISRLGEHCAFVKFEGADRRLSA